MLVDKTSVLTTYISMQHGLHTAAELLDFLEGNWLVENNHSCTITLYSLTIRGEAVCRRLTISKRLYKLKLPSKFKENKDNLPILAEKTKRKEVKSGVWL